MQDIQNIKNEAFAQITNAKSAADLEKLRIVYLGRNGKLTNLLKNIKELKADKRKEAGLLLNQSKETIEKLISDQKNKIKNSARDWFDPTIPGIKPQTGHLHLITQAVDEISTIFERIGFVRQRYPEVEWDFFAFGALNFPENHPARDEWETYFVDAKESPKYGKMLLTPHTSSGQVREMQRVGTPPIRMLNIAKNYRRQSDASHVTMLHQFEGLAIDKGINITHLKGTLEYFVESYYGKGVKIRLRPHHFQFTEPSFEVDISCTVCAGKGCKLCKDGWLEQAGAGLVHPNVLKNGGINPKVYSGFAFGWGVERALMMKPGLNIPDIRILYGQDLEYLKQF
jgi:phenylalanyl-tRNA synthetase alpha chain